MAFIIGGTAGAVIGAGAIGAGANLVGSAIGANAASNAADTQAQGARDANALQLQMYNQTRADNEPWRQAGIGALGGLQNADFQRDFVMSDFQKDPGYDFRMQQGQQALERSAAARGGRFSGGTLKALSRYGQDYASNEYQNAYNRFNSDRDRRFNRLSSLAGLGQTATGAVGNAGMNYGNAAAGNITGAANAAGAAGIAGANAWASGLNGIGRGVQDAIAMNQQNNWMNQWLQNQGGKV
jgi:hypothetical protein